MELSLSENKKFLVIDTCTELEYEQLKSSLTKKNEIKFLQVYGKKY